ncbi:MAG: ATP-binding protein [Alphaproteobacteria bacterium]
MSGFYFNDYRIDVSAMAENLETVCDFVFNLMKKHNFSNQAISEIGIVIDEIYSNIVRYAYRESKGSVSVLVCPGSDPETITLTFMDSGQPFNPLEAEDPDVSCGIESRDIYWSFGHIYGKTAYDFGGIRI